MNRNGHDDRTVKASRADAVAIVTGGSSGAGREVALGLASWGWAIVVVYLDHQRRAEATVAAILAAGGTTVAVCADLADDLDVQRLFAEASLAFGGVDAVVHTTTASASHLLRHAVRNVREGGAIVSVCGTEEIPAALQRELRERGITVGRAPPREVVSRLDEWRRRPVG
jgi:short chain dehydrogenase